MIVRITQIENPKRVAMCILLAETLGIPVSTAKVLVDKTCHGINIDIPNSVNILSFANYCGLYGYKVE